MAPFPLTYEQIKERDKVFIQSIDAAAVCQLASHHNNAQPCRIFQESRNGSYNVCFFVEFTGDGTRWVVRFPLVANVYDPWAKIQNEVATLRYIQAKSTIPVPKVFGYGPGGAADAASNPTGLAYIVLEWIPGEPLNFWALIKDKRRDLRQAFYDKLVDVHAQMYQLEFDCAGSLVLGADGEPAPVLGPALSPLLNDLQVEKYGGGSGGTGGGDDDPFAPATFATALDFARHHFALLQRACDPPMQDLTRDEARLEVYALHDLPKRLAELVAPPDDWDGDRDRDRFVLAHPDLRLSNILVDDDRNIVGIIDWEWTCTVPAQLFAPPTWIAGQVSDYAADLFYRIEYRWLFDVVIEKAETSPACRAVKDGWGRRLARQGRFALAVILRHHGGFVRLYYDGIFPLYHEERRSVLIPRFYEEDGEACSFTKDARNRLELSRAYNQFLKDNGLYVSVRQAKAEEEAETEGEKTEEKTETEGDNARHWLSSRKPTVSSRPSHKNTT